MQRKTKKINYDVSVIHTSIYIGLGFQILPKMISVSVDAPSSQKLIERISSQVCILSRRCLFQASLYVFYP